MGEACTLYNFSFSFFTACFLLRLTTFFASMSLVASSSLTVHQWLHHPFYMWVHAYHIWILGFAVGVVLLSLVLLWRAERPLRL